MKRLLTAAALLLSLASSSDALTIDYETVSGYKNSGPSYSYDIGFFDNAIHIEPKLL